VAQLLFVGGTRAMKHDDPSSGIKHFQQVVGLAERLQPLGVAIYYHEWYCLVMGSWSFVAGSRHQSYRFTWDGREGWISVFGPFHASEGVGSRAPHIITDRLGFGATIDPLKYVETFFEKNRAA